MNDRTGGSSLSPANGVSPGEAEEVLHRQRVLGDLVVRAYASAHGLLLSVGGLWSGSSTASLLVPLALAIFWVPSLLRPGSLVSRLAAGVSISALALVHRLMFSQSMDGGMVALWLFAATALVVYCDWRVCLVVLAFAGAPVSLSGLSAWTGPSESLLVAAHALICMLAALGARRAVISAARQQQEIDGLKVELCRVADSQKQALLDAATEVAIIAADPIGTITVFNHGAERMLGWSAEEMIGKKTLADVHLAPELEYRVRELASEAGREFQPIEALLDVPRRLGMEHREWTYLCKSGKRIFVHLAITTVCDSAGRVTGFLGVANDITEQKWAEAERQRYVSELESVRTRLEDQARELAAQAERLRDAQQRAEAANRAKSEFLANMSHEIRTPMTAILGFADLLCADEDPETTSPTRLDALQTIRRNGEHLLEIINDILDISKIEAGKLTCETVRFSPMQVSNDVILLMRTRAEAKGLALRLELDGPLPETIESDPTRFRQILINLVGNAIKFTESGEVRVRVMFEAGVLEGAKLRVEVRDTGIGMTSEQMSRLFRPFTQADSSMSRRFGGSGLGLTISLRLAEMLGGTIAVRSRPGEGSTFTATIAAGLPGRLTTDPHTSSQSLPDSASLPVIPENCTILLAEDGVDNQRLITHVLRKAGAQVTVAENGRLAMEAAMDRVKSGKPFDVILMDMQMPELDGYSATRLLRKEGYRMPIVALTAHAMEEDRLRCLAAGCDDYTTKPINRQILLRMVAQYASMAGGRWRESLLENLARTQPMLPAIRHESTLATVLSH